MSFPRFDRPVPDDGYAWWYVDAVSDDGRHALTVIAFIGSVFSPYYAWARRRGATAAHDHCAVNVALYGPGSRWAMTERGRHDLQAAKDQLAIGPSTLSWDGRTLSIQVNEWSVPIPRRLRGTIRIDTDATGDIAYPLDAESQLLWQPIAPRARAKLSMISPALDWQGTAYIDHNRGAVPLETSFDSWQWSRAAIGEDTAVLYDVSRRDGTSHNLALRFDDNCKAQSFEPPGMARLPTTGWRIARATRSDTGQAKLVETLENTPFYARSRITSTLFGEPVESIHESLALVRFDTQVVRLMLPFRMPRRASRIRGR